VIMRIALALCLAVVAIPAQAATRYVATNGSDSNPGTSGSPYLTWNKCFQVSALGDICLLRAGSYPAQTFVSNGLSGNASRAADGSHAVTFQPESGTVTVSHVGIGSFQSGATASHIIIKGVQFTDMGFMKGTDLHVTNSKGIFVFVACVQYFSIEDSELTGDSGALGDQGDAIDMYAGECSTSTTGPPTNQGLIARNRIHDMVTTNLPGDHPDAIGGCAGGCGSAGGIKNVTLSGNKFWNNAGHNLGMEDGDSFDLIENNFFGLANGVADNGVDGYNGFGTIVRNNTIGIPPYPLSGSGGSGQYWTGNIIIDSLSNYGGCPPATSKAEYNVWLTGGNATCGGGPNTIVSSFSGYFVNPSRTVGDYHLTANATLAIGHGNPSNYPPTDIDGQTRTSPPDAGAHERSASGPAPPLGLIVTVN
jgi:hypothetical protein